MTFAPPFESLLADHLAMIRRIAAAYEANASAREDLVQDILCAVWRALPTFRGESPLQAFVARIAAYRAITHVRSAVKVLPSGELPGDLATSEPGPEAQAIAMDERAGLLAALRKLPIGLREPALLALEGLAASEIAAILGITPNAVAVRMTRARSKLRQHLGV